MELKMSRTKKWQAPDWRYKESYGDVDAWSYRRWAWEFLRRNAEYQKLGPMGGMSSVHLNLARKFGRVKIRPYWSEYDNKEEMAGVWLVDQVIAAHGWEGWDSKPQTPLNSTEISIKFDLSVVMASGEIALNVLMAKIKAIVTEEMEYRWDEDDFPEKLIRRPKKSDLLLYLQLIDAGKASSLELAPFLYPQYCTPSGLADPLLVTGGAHNISRQRSKAKKLVEREYLCLVPIEPQDSV